jgi:hypothetical protein
MPLRYLVDENLRGPFWSALVRANAGHHAPIEITCIGEYNAPPLGSKDPEILIWAEREQRILIYSDFSTLPNFLNDHLRAGRHSPGVFLIRRGSSFPEVVEFLVLAAYASEPWEWRDRCQFISI